MKKEVRIVGDINKVEIEYWLFKILMILPINLILGIYQWK